MTVSSRQLRLWFQLELPLEVDELVRPEHVRTLQAELEDAAALAALESTGGGNPHEPSQAAAELTRKRSRAALMRDLATRPAQPPLPSHSTHPPTTPLAGKRGKPRKGRAQS